MHGRGIKPFTKRVEDCRPSLNPHSAGSGAEYQKWLEDEQKRRVAAMIERDRNIRGLATAEDVPSPD